MDNILIQVRGEKRVLLFQPEGIGGLYMVGAGASATAFRRRHTRAYTSQQAAACGVLRACC